VTASETHSAIHAVFRIESPRLIAGLTRLVRDVGVAEELAQDALRSPGKSRRLADGDREASGTQLLTSR
jgi:DNA-directed RNA polymerase specialized sigma24 family protein